MKKALVILAALSLPACTDQYGRTDPGSTALLGGVAGAALGYGVGQANTRRDDSRYYDRNAYYGRPYAYQQPSYPSQSYYGRPYAYQQPPAQGYYGRPYYRQDTPYGYYR